MRVAVISTLLEHSACFMPSEDVATLAHHLRKLGHTVSAHHLTPELLKGWCTTDFEFPPVLDADPACGQSAQVPEWIAITTKVASLTAELRRMPPPGPTSFDVWRRETLLATQLRLLMGLRSRYTAIFQPLIESQMALTPAVRDAAFGFLKGLLAATPKPDAVVLGYRLADEWLSMLALARVLKAEFRVPVILSGTGFQSHCDATDLIEVFLDADYIVVGDAVVGVPPLLEAIAKTPPQTNAPKAELLKAVPGLVWRDAAGKATGAGVQAIPGALLASLDGLEADYSGVAFAEFLTPAPIVSLTVALGAAVANGDASLSFAPHRVRSVAKAVAEVQRLGTAYGVSNIELRGQVHATWLAEFAAAIDKAGVRARFGVPHLVPDAAMKSPAAFAAGLAKGGVRSVTLVVPSASYSISELVPTPVPTDVAVAALPALFEVGVMGRVVFHAGWPTQRLDDVATDFITFKPYSSQVHTADVRAGSALHQRFAELGVIDLGRQAIALMMPKGSTVPRAIHSHSVAFVSAEDELEDVGTLAARTYREFSLTWPLFSGPLELALGDWTGPHTVTLTPSLPPDEALAYQRGAMNEALFLRTGKELATDRWPNARYELLFLSSIARHKQFREFAENLLDRCREMERQKRSKAQKAEWERLARSTTALLAMHLIGTNDLDAALRAIQRLPAGTPEFDLGRSLALQAIYKKLDPQAAKALAAVPPALRGYSYWVIALTTFNQELKSEWPNFANLAEALMALLPQSPDVRNMAAILFDKTARFEEAQRQRKILRRLMEVANEAKQRAAYDRLLAKLFAPAGAPTAGADSNPA